MMGRISLSIVFIILFFTQAHGQNSVSSKATLNGLEGVCIYVEPLAPEVEEKGITDVVLKAEIERHLREAKIPILNPDLENQSTMETPTLYLQVTALVSEYVEECIYAIRLELTQAVQLVRDEGFPVFQAATWSIGGVGFYTKDWRQALINDVIGYADEFVESYVQANPHSGG